MVPMGIVIVECLIAVFADWFRPRNDPAADPGPNENRGKLAVLIPAHNEQRSIQTAIECVQRQTAVGDRIVVIADNCDDQTEQIAVKMGVEVVVRRDASRRGKEFALVAGIRYLQQNPPDAVVVFDADCYLEDGALNVLRRSVSLDRPVQIRYTMSPPTPAGIFDRCSSFAVTIKNMVRPYGLSVLGLPCMINGAGVAIPWSQWKHALPAAFEEEADERAHRALELTEDYTMCVRLARAGHFTSFEPFAGVTSELPGNSDGKHDQRRRWEHGSLVSAPRFAASLMLAAVRDRDIRYLGLLAECVVPPLALLLATWMTLLGAAGLGWIALGSQLGLFVCFALLVWGGLMGASILLAWMRFGTHIIPFWELVRVPCYIFQKLPVYFEFLWNREKEWKRTTRDVPASKAP